MSEIPEFLAVGHVTHDQVSEGFRPGGAALYAAHTASRLGKRVAVLTSCGSDFSEEHWPDRMRVKILPARRTSTFRNQEIGGVRSQHVCAEAAPLDASALPYPWTAAEVVCLSPVMHEVPLTMGDLFPESLLGVLAQGWFRTWDGTGRVSPRRWQGFEALLRKARVVSVSQQDLAGNEDLVETFITLTPVVAVTRGAQGASVYTAGRELRFGTFRVCERDATGAGDCFGAAFLIRYRETGDVEEAGRFASCVASFVVEAEGIGGVPTRRQVSERMAREPLSVETR